MTGLERGFTKGEYKRRTDALQSEMRKAGLAAILLTTEADIRYVTGFLTRFWESPTRPWFVAVPASGTPTAVIPSIGAALMARTWIADIRTWQSPDPADEGISLLASTLTELTPPSGLIGIPMGPETHLRMPLADYGRLNLAIRPRDFVDATAIIRHVREAKSEPEIEKIRATCGVACRAFDRLTGIVAVGRPLDLVFREFQIACLYEGADWVPYLAGGAGPGGYEDIISPASTRPLCRGDLLMLDTGVARDGYFCDIDRNFAIAKTDDATRRAYETLFAATEAGIAAARPGARASDVYHVMKNVISGSGAKGCEGRFGHGLGIQLTEWPSLTAEDDTVLREGMVITIEPSLEAGPGLLMVHEENVVLRADRAELLSSRAQSELPVIS